MTTDIQEAVNNSGYPLQMHLKELINRSNARHRWRVLAEEHRWTNTTTNEEGFIDLILTRDGSDLKLIVECKRIIGNWTFLLSTEKVGKQGTVKTLMSNIDTENLLWKKLNIDPYSYQSSYCVLDIAGKKDSRTLEKLSGELLLSLEELAKEEFEIRKGQTNNASLYPYNNTIFYLPVIVTTANLSTITFDPINDVDIKNGKIKSSEISPVSFIRFHKNLATDLDYSKPKMADIRKSNQENDRTVLVVHSENFVDFLANIDTE